jgi:hypothetical protein
MGTRDHHSNESIDQSYTGLARLGRSPLRVRFKRRRLTAVSPSDQQTTENEDRILAKCSLLCPRPCRFQSRPETSLKRGQNRVLRTGCSRIKYVTPKLKKPAGRRASSISERWGGGLLYAFTPNWPTTRRALETRSRWGMPTCPIWSVSDTEPIVYPIHPFAGVIRLSRMRQTAFDELR